MWEERLCSFNNLVFIKTINKIIETAKNCKRFGIAYSPFEPFFVRGRAAAI
jgi:hypothetical protein